MPAKRIHPPPNAVEEIKTLAATGFSLVGIAAHFSVSPETVDRWFAGHPAIKQAFAFGREQERHALHNALYRKAIEKGDSIAAMFLLKSRHGYREGDQSDQANKVAITFNLPGALTAEQYQLAKVAKVKVIDGDSNADNAEAEQLPAAATLDTRRV